MDANLALLAGSATDPQTKSSQRTSLLTSEKFALRVNIALRDLHSQLTAQQELTTTSWVQNLKSNAVSALLALSIPREDRMVASLVVSTLQAQKEPQLAPARDNTEPSLKVTTPADVRVALNSRDLLWETKVWVAPMRIASQLSILDATLENLQSLLMELALLQAMVKLQLKTYKISRFNQVFVTMLAQEV